MKIHGRIFTISNVLSFSRIIIIWPITHYLLKGTPEGNFTAFVLMLIGAATDFLDGFLARALHQESDMGRIIDPLADKIGLALLGIVLTRTRTLPVWFLVLIIVRDLAILLLGSKMIAGEDRIPESNWYGKTAVAGIACVVIFYTLGLTPLKEIALFLTVILLLISMVSYLKIYHDFRRSESR